MRQVTAALPGLAGARYRRMESRCHRLALARPTPAAAQHAGRRARRAAVRARRSRHPGQSGCHAGALARRCSASRLEPSQPDDSILGRITVLLGRRASQRLVGGAGCGESSRTPAPPPPPRRARPRLRPRLPNRSLHHAANCVTIRADGASAFQRASDSVPRRLPADVEARRAVAALQGCDERRTSSVRSSAQLRSLTPERAGAARHWRHSGGGRRAGSLAREDSGSGDSGSDRRAGRGACGRGYCGAYGGAARRAARAAAERAHLVHAVGSIGRRLGRAGRGCVSACGARSCARRIARPCGGRRARHRAAAAAESQSKVPEVVAAAAEFLGLSGQSARAPSSDRARRITAMSACGKRRCSVWPSSAAARSRGPRCRR